MELLLENVKNTFINRNSKVPRAALRLAASSYTRFAIIVVCSLLFGRVALFYAVFPCGIALITVLMSKSRGNIYALPLIVAGLMTNYGTGYEVICNAIATVACGVVFFFLFKIKVSIVIRALFAAGIMVITKSVYFFLSSLVLVYDVFMMCVETLLILALVYIFHIFFNLIDKDTKAKNSIAEGIVAMTTVAVLLVGGIGIELIGPASPVQLGALLITLFIGYKMGVMEGGVAGIVSGILVMMMASGSPAIIGIFACAGIVAGFFQGLSRIVTGACFAAVCLAFGLVRGYPELYISIYDPLIAAFIFMALPSCFMKKLEIVFAKIRRDDAYYELVARERIKNTLKGYLETFEKLSLLYNGTKNTSAILSMQFKGMAKAVNIMIEELSSPDTLVMQSREKYSIKVGVSGYSKEGGVSGDSYLCSDFKPGEYMLALSDGMGKGQRALDESALTVTTLFNLMKAGFDVELALKTINNLLLMKSSDEIFSTVDLGIFNKTNGKIKLFKIGAAATFVKRGDKVEVIKVSALPMGIVDSINVSNVEFQARRGDEIIIVSDGITDADRNDAKMEWIKEAILNIRSRDPQTMSDLLINKAVERYGLKEKDDMTVITAVIH